MNINVNHPEYLCEINSISQNTIHDQIDSYLLDDYKNDIAKIDSLELINILEQNPSRSIDTCEYLNGLEIRKQILFRNEVFIKKKRGRKEKEKENEKEKEEKNNKSLTLEKKIHNKNRIDNIITKVQVHFLTFIISFLNDIISNLNYKQRFLHLDHKFKRNVKKEFFESLKYRNIGDIICNSISSKYKIYNNDRNTNIHIYNEVIKNNALKKLFSENYINIFRKIYLQSEKLINLKEYGIDKTINLSDEVKMYNDLVKDIETSISKKDYKTHIDKCVNLYFLTQKKFKIIH